MLDFNISFSTHTHNRVYKMKVSEFACFVTSGFITFIVVMVSLCLSILVDVECPAGLVYIPGTRKCIDEVLYKNLKDGNPVTPYRQLALCMTTTCLIYWVVQFIIHLRSSEKKHPAAE